MAITTAEKLVVMRESERMTRRAVSQLTGMPYGTLADCELGRSNMGLETAKKLLKHPRFKKYTMWFLFDDINPKAGQITPALAHIGPNGIELHPLQRSTG